MSLSETSNSEPVPYWTILEAATPFGVIYTFSLVQLAHNPREAAMRSAGFQMADDWRPRRIMVYPEAPKIYEWIQIRPYIMDVGKEIGGIN